MAAKRQTRKRQVATSPTEKEPKWQCPGRIQDEIVYLATTTGWAPAQIYDDVRFGLARRKRENEMPSKRTVERMVKHYRTTTALEAWRVGDKGQDGAFMNTPEDAVSILEVLVNAMLYSGGRKRFFTKAEAAWVLRIRKMLPDVDVLKVWRIARAYLLTESRGHDSAALDMYLAITPWRSKSHFEHYLKSALEKWIESTEDTWDETRYDVRNAYGGPRDEGEAVPLAEQPLPTSLLEWSPDQIQERANVEQEEWYDLWLDSKRKGEAEDDDFSTYMKRKIDAMEKRLGFGEEER